MKVRIADLIEEERVLYSVKRLRDVDGHRCSAKRWFLLIEAVGDTSDSGKESGSGRVERAKAMLGGGGGESRREKGEDEPFKDLRSGTKRGNGTVRGRD